MASCEREEKGSQMETTGSQMGAKEVLKRSPTREPKGCQNEKGTSKSIVCGTGAKQVGNMMKKDYNVCQKGVKKPKAMPKVIKDQWKTGNGKTHENH